MSDILTPRPLFFTAKKSQAPHLRTWAEVKKLIQTGAYGSLWNQIEKQARKDLQEEPLTPSSMPPGRDPEQALHANRDFSISVAVCQRILRAALLFKITGDKAFKEGCLEQIKVLCDPEIWVEWRDKSHVHIGIPADLRTGWISRDVAIAYNWLRSSLTAKQRQSILHGIEQMGIKPFLDSLPMDPLWIKSLSNWTTCVVGGMGICGMALGNDHPDAAKLVEFSKPIMESYFSIFGPEGEFNESPGYAGSMMLVAKYYSALRCIEPDSPDRLAAFPFPESARWIQYLSLGPKRLAGYGDTHLNAPPFVPHYAAVAAATRDPVIQGLAKHFEAPAQGYTAPDVFKFIWFDPTVPAKKPGADYPLHATFKAHAACFSSRSDWKPSGADCVVYGKAGREPHHAQADVGQICIDAHGERLIRDLGLPAGGYPADYFGEFRTQYYNASVLGHNLLTINDQEHPDVATNGHFLSEGALPDGLGAYWVYDLQACHPHAISITRSVFHFQPNIVVVIDEARTEKRASFRQRWHTAKPIKIKPDGTFHFSEGKAGLSACVKSFGRSQVTHESGRHAYHAPYNRNRLGEKLKQPREPYVDTITSGKHCRLLTAFATGSSAIRLPRWQMEKDTLSFTPKQHGSFSLSLRKDVLHYETPRGQGSFKLVS